MKKHIMLSFVILMLLLIPSLSFADFFADTNGDGVVDDVYVCGSPAQVCIYHPNTGQTTMYRGGSWVNFTINSVADTNGVAGAEVIVVWSDAYGTSKGVDVINDRDRTLFTYGYNTASNFSINSVIDTDGASGNEIVVVWTDAYGTSKGVDVIRDSNRTRTTYGYNAEASFSINSVIDTDGIAGADIIVVWTFSQSNMGIDVIHDASRSKVAYGYSNYTSLSINKVTDTDGNAGADIVVIWATSSSNFGIDVIHDALRSKWTYGYSNYTSLSINSIADTDNIAGGEIIVIWSAVSSRGIDVIHDRPKTKNTYPYTNKGPFEIRSVADTDGIGGLEIIVRYPTGTYPVDVLKAVDVIHDGNRTTNAYDFTNYYYFNIQAIKDFDSITGVEVCTYWERTPNSGYILITDRTRSVQSRANCN